MLQDIFYNVINMSITASVVFIIVLLLRQLFKNNFPKFFSYFLCLLVLLRLLIPFSVSTTVSIFNIIQIPRIQSYNDFESFNKSHKEDVLNKKSYGTNSLENKGYIDQTTLNTIDQGRITEKSGTKNTNQHSTSEILNVQEGDLNSYSGERLKNNSQKLWKRDTLWTKDIVVLFWFLIFILFALTYIIFYYKGVKKFNEASLYNNSDLINQCRNKVKLGRRIKVYTSDMIITPLVCGLIKPRVILPTHFVENCTISELQNIITHEFVHIKRFDYLLKPLSALALGIHWFNPLVWYFFIMFQKDMELSCDEKVLALWGNNIRNEYASLLIKFAVKEKRIINEGLAFGESDIKNRVKGIMKFKRSGMWLLTIVFLSVVLLGFILLTNGKTDTKEGAGEIINALVEDERLEKKGPEIIDNKKESENTENIEEVTNESKDFKLDEQVSEDEVLNLLAQIQKNAPEDISEREDYFKRHNDFNKLVNMGQPALDIMMNLFSKNNEDGLEEYIMAYACSILKNISDKEKGFGTNSGREWYYKYGVFDDIMQIRDADYLFFIDCDGKPKEVLPKGTNMKDINDIIENYILSVRRRSFCMGEKGVEAHKIYRTEEKDGIITAYIISSFSWFGFENGVFAELSGYGIAPIRMKFRLKGNGEYEIIECNDIFYIEKDKERVIEEIFPEDLAQLIIMGDKKTEEELKDKKINKARGYLIKIKRQDAEISLDKTKDSTDEKFRNAIYYVALMKPEIPEFVGSKEVLVNKGGPAGVSVRCKLETKCNEVEEGIVVEYKKTWNFSISGEKVRSYWKYLVIGTRVELIECDNNDNKINMK